MVEGVDIKLTYVSYLDFKVLQLSWKRGMEKKVSSSVNIDLYLFQLPPEGRK